jgi:hypothetical protein
MTDYEHTETGWVIIVVMGATMAGIYAAFTFGAMPGGGGVQALMQSLLLLSLLNFYRQRVTVDGQAVRLSMGLGLIRRRVPLAEIASAAPFKAPWLYGWGIHYVGDGWIFNVSSLDCVELRFKNGRRLLVGTDDQLALHAAIAGRLAKI